MPSYATARPSNDASDRISNLPESLLCHILSHLPTEEAVATSLLSRRWKSLWRNIHNLSFREPSDYNGYIDLPSDSKVKFANFVNKVLTFLNGQTMDNFSLHVEDYCELYDVTTWMTTALARNLKKLKFFSDGSDPGYKLPYSLFTCETLEDLCLSGNVTCDVPSLVCLPRLKSLTLELVTYKCDQCVHKLLSGCSSLETLYIVRDASIDVVTLTISSPTLRDLTLINLDAVDLADSKLEIYATSLRYLHLHNEISMNFSVENLCSLEEAKFSMRIRPIDDDGYCKAVYNLLRGVSNVKHLSLCVDIFKILSHVGVCPSFPRLTRLSVAAKCCKWNLLLNLVDGLKKLEFLTLTIEKDFSVPDDVHVTNWSEPKKVPTCLKSCLQTMSIYRFKGLEDELALVAYILKNGEVLRRMKIELERPSNLEARFELLEKVSEFARGSKICEIMLS